MSVRLRTSKVLAPCDPTCFITIRRRTVQYIPIPSNPQLKIYSRRFSWNAPRGFTPLFPERQPQKNQTSRKPTLRENIYTVPNLLTASRILICPVLGWSIVDGNFALATSLLAYAGITDWIDGYIARRYQMRSVIGTILDPAADKTLMTTLTLTLAWKGLLPVPLAGIILGRDVLLSLSAFYYRYISLPPPKTFWRYWDFSIPSAEVRPTEISKINTALQLLLMGVTTITPLLAVNVMYPIMGLQWLVAGTTIWSGLSYIFSKDAIHIIDRSQKR